MVLVMLYTSEDSERLTRLFCGIVSYKKPMLAQANEGMVDREVVVDHEAFHITANIQVPL